MFESDVFEEFYLAHYSSIYKLVYRYVFSHTDTENVVQDVFLELLKVSKSLPESQWLQWSYNKARNKRRSFTRSEKRRRQRDSSFFEMKESHHSPIDLERRDLIARALSKMPSDKADLLELSHLSGISSDEIARIMEVKVGSLPKLLKRAEKYFLKAYQSLVKGDTSEK